MEVRVGSFVGAGRFACVCRVASKSLGRRIVVGGPFKRRSFCVQHHHVTAGASTKPGDKLHPLLWLAWRLYWESSPVLLDAFSSGAPVLSWRSWGVVSRVLREFGFCLSSGSSLGCLGPPSSRISVASSCWGLSPQEPAHFVRRQQLVLPFEVVDLGVDPRSRRFRLPC